MRSSRTFPSEKSGIGVSVVAWHAREPSVNCEHFCKGWVHRMTPE